MYFFIDTAGAHQYRSHQGTTKPQSSYAGDGCGATVSQSLHYYVRNAHTECDGLKGM